MKGMRLCYSYIFFKTLPAVFPVSNIVMLIFKSNARSATSVSSQESTNCLCLYQSNNFTKSPYGFQTVRCQCVAVEFRNAIDNCLATSHAR